MLTPTDLGGRVDWLGRVPDRAASLRSEPVERARLGFDGIAGDGHAGLTRPSCSRVTAQYVRGTPIRNARQLSVLSREEIATIAAAMDLDAIDPSWLGANLVLDGLPELTRLPPSSRLIFEGGAAIVVDMENGPCQFPAREIEREHPGKGAGFIAAARGRRGVTAWVEREGDISIGETARLHVPPLAPYRPLAEP